MKKVCKKTLLPMAKPLGIVLVAILLAQTGIAEAAGTKISPLKEGRGGGKVRTLSNPTSIVINDTCADPDKAECAALLDYYNPVPTPTDPVTGISQLAPEMPVTKASPYVNYIEVPDFAFPKKTTITDVNVTINDIHHGYLNDVDIMLVAPNGQWVMLASNVSAAGATEEGGVLGVEAKGLNWKFDDSATLPLPNTVRDDGRLSGRATNPLFNVVYDEWVGTWTDTALRTYKPTDYDSYLDSDHFPQVVPSSQGVAGINAVPGVNAFNNSRAAAALTQSTVFAPVTATDVTTYKKLLSGPSLSSLNGISPVGQWRLIVVDDFHWFGGEIRGGWSLEITAKK